MALAFAALSNAHAACANPAGESGQQGYASNYGVMVFCNGTNWVSMAGGVSVTIGGTSGATTLDELTDVSTGGAGIGSALLYNGSSWAPGAVQDARIGTITDTKWCKASGSTITCTTDAPLLATATLNDLSDVDTTGVAIGKVLSYNGTNWVVSDSTPASTALGDRITSGTTSVIAYLNTGVSVSKILEVSGPVSTTRLRLAGTNTPTCADGSPVGTIRYEPTIKAFQMCRE